LKCFFNLVQTFAPKQGALRGHLGPSQIVDTFVFALLLILLACGFAPAFLPFFVTMPQTGALPLSPLDGWIFL
jgi:hypothetical protein